MAHSGTAQISFGCSAGCQAHIADIDIPQNLAPTYEQLADAFANSKDKVIIAKVDADGAGKPLGQKYGVTGFPST